MRILLSLVMFFSVSNFAHAAGYGDAGCGLGSIVFGSKQGFIQIFAATTNGTFGSQTFGITSGTSNCRGGGKTVAVFIEANKVALSNDIARGQGEALNSLAYLYGCKNPSEIGQSLQTNYSSIFPAADVKAEQIESSITTILRKAQVGSCELV